MAAADPVALVSRARASADGKGIAMHLWDAATGVTLGFFKGGLCVRGGLCASRGVVLAAQADRGAITAWRWNSETSCIKIPMSEKITALAMTHNALYCLAGTASGTLYLWEIASGRMLACVRSAHYRRISAIVVLGDDATCATAGDDALVRVWPLLSLCGGLHGDGVSAAATKPLFSLHQHSLPVTALYGSLGMSAGARLYSGGKDRHCHIWDVATGALLGSVAVPSDITCLVVDPAEVYLYIGTGSGSIYRVLLHDVALERSSAGWAARPKHQFAAHTAAVQDMAVTADGTQLVTVALDGQLRLWDAFSLQALKLWTDEPLNNVILVPRAWTRDAPSHPMPVTLFARELHINSDVVHDAKARELSTCLLPGDARSVESAEERALAARQMLTRLPLASVSGVGHVRPTTAASMDGDGSAVKTSEVEAEPAGAGSKAEARRLRKEVAAWRDAATELMGREGKALGAELDMLAATTQVAASQEGGKRATGKGSARSKRAKARN